MACFTSMTKNPSPSSWKCRSRPPIAADRLDKIIRAYFTNLKLKEVWYFVTNDEVRKAVERTIGAYDGFRIINWEGAA